MTPSVSNNPWCQHVVALAIPRVNEKPQRHQKHPSDSSTTLGVTKNSQRQQQFPTSTCGAISNPPRQQKPPASATTLGVTKNSRRHQKHPASATIPDLNNIRHQQYTPASATIFDVINKPQRQHVVPLATSVSTITPESRRQQQFPTSA